MSLYSALYAGVSGLNAQSSAMATVADNITNVNTVGYKGKVAQFQTMVNSSALASSYSAGGVTATAQSLISKQGVLQASSSLTDIGIDGNGFFVVRSSADASGTTAYTRAGSFSTDSAGYLRNTAGYYLMGWPTDAQGKTVSNGNPSALTAVRPNAFNGLASPTTSMELRANLNASAETTAYSEAGLLDGTLTPAFSRPIDVYDQQGNAHTLTVNFFKTGTNEWTAAITGASEDSAVPSGVLNTATLTFGADGSLSSIDPAVNTMAINWANGAGTSTISLDYGTVGALDGITQLGSASALIASTVDGGLLGAVASVSISDTGLVSAIFEDGTTRPIYQLPLATFQNPDGLTRISGNAYLVSAESGSAAINAAATGGSGSLSSSMLEASTVDLAAEFSNMILFQRAYSASSKIITTVDDMLQEVSNLKR